MATKATAKKKPNNSENIENLADKPTIKIPMSMDDPNKQPEPEKKNEKKEPEKKKVEIENPEKSQKVLENQFKKFEEFANSVVEEERKKLLVVILNLQKQYYGKIPFNWLDAKEIAKKNEDELKKYIDLISATAHRSTVTNLLRLGFLKFGGFVESMVKEVYFFYPEVKTILDFDVDGYGKVLAEKYEEGYFNDEISEITAKVMPNIILGPKLSLALKMGTILVDQASLNAEKKRELTQRDKSYTSKLD